MLKTDLKTIEEMCGGHGLEKKYHNLPIQGVSIDTRTIEKNQLFVPLLGDNFDAHKFITSAADNGARASIWQEDRPTDDVRLPVIYVKDSLEALQNLARSYRKLFNIKLVGITGSDGKTSTKDILSQILAKKFKTHTNRGNLNNHIGVPLTLLDMDKSTELAVIEMGVSDFGEMRLLSSITQPDIALITNIGEAHLEGFKTKENIAKGKMEILENLSPGGLYLYNGDDEILRASIGNIDPNIKARSFGKSKDNDYVIVALESGPYGSKFQIPLLGDMVFEIPMLGEHQIYNASGAIIIANYLGLEIDDILDALANIKLTSMRQELISNGQLTILNDSYKSNPSSLKAALKTFHKLDGYGQKILIIGDMLGLGEREVEMHREIADHIDPEEIDYLFTIGDLSKSLGEALTEKSNKIKVQSFRHKLDVAKEVKKILGKKPIILIKASRHFELETLAEELLEEV